MPVPDIVIVGLRYDEQQKRFLAPFTIKCSECGHREERMFAFVAKPLSIYHLLEKECNNCKNYFWTNVKLQDKNLWKSRDVSYGRFHNFTCSEG